MSTQYKRNVLKQFDILEDKLHLIDWDMLPEWVYREINQELINLKSLIANAYINNKED